VRPRTPEDHLAGQGNYLDTSRWTLAPGSTVDAWTRLLDWMIRKRLAGSNLACLSGSYVVQEKDRPGNIDVAKLRKLGLPPGPLYKKLIDGCDVVLANGRVIRPAEVRGGRDWVASALLPPQSI
jgi:hypothetical protein